MYMVKKTVKRRTSPSLEKVDVIPMLKCKNVKYGCDVRAKKYTCYTHTKYKRNKVKADTITLTRSKKGTRKLEKPVIRIIDWYRCPE